MISVSIVTYKTPQAELEKCVACLRASALVASVRIIDNTGHNVGYGAGHNIAIREAQEKYHLVINSDVTFPEGTLEYLYDYMERNPDVGQCIPRTIYPNGDIQAVCRLLPTPADLFLRRFLPSSWGKRRREEYTLKNSGFDREMNIPYHMGCFMLFRRAALEKIAILKGEGRGALLERDQREQKGEVQYFDERFFLYPEDIDITRRMHRIARTMFVPAVTITHHHRQGSYHSLRLTCVHIYNMCKYFSKWGWIFDDERRRWNAEVKRLYL